MGHRVSEEVTLGVEQRLDISHSWGLIIWCRNRDEGLDNVVYGSILCQKTFGQALIVYAGGHFEIFETLRFVQKVLQLSPPVQERLRTWLSEHLNQIQKRE